MKKLVFLFAACFFMQSIVSYAQLSTGESPVSFSLHQINWRVPAVTLPALDMATINKEDSIDNENGMPPRFGYPHKVNLNLENAGEWKVLPNGDRLWNLTITCPGAKSINLLYDKYWLPKGAKLFVYSKDKTHTIGAFTSKNNKGTKDELRGFATGLVYSDTVVVEYYVPNEVAYNGVVSIAYVVQGYRYINVNRNSVEYGSSGSCQVNVNCQEGQEWQNEKKAVALILVNGYRYCTGSLINTTANDNRPLFLTANHCLGGWANNDTNYDAITKPNLDHYSFWWNYETPGCSNLANEPSHYSTSGATVVANNPASDFALLSLTEDPKDNPNIKTYYLGWDRSGNAGTGGVGIHHPCGDVKKISTYYDQPISTDYLSSTQNSSSSHWRVIWNATSTNHGTTEGGSSGSALLNNSRKIIGQLHGGYSSCYNLYVPDWYGKFSVSWTGNGAVDNRRKLQPWLDPLNTGAIILGGIGSTPDLFIRDTVTDDGTMPSSAYKTWDSPDIWVEDMNGNVVDNPQGNSVYKVCVRIHNRRDVASSGTEKLLLNWAKAGFNDQWYEYWTCDNPLPCGFGLCKGDVIGDANGISLPSIPANGSCTVKVSWNTPMAEAYAECTDFSCDQWHFCLLARIHDDDTIAHENERYADVHTLVRNHNNVAQKNVYLSTSVEYQVTIDVGNAKPIDLNRIICLNPKVVNNVQITDYAEVYITLDAGLLAAINSNANITGLDWVNSNTLRWNGGSASIPVTLPANSYYTLQTTIHFLADQIPATNNFDFDMVLRNAAGDSILGGEHYQCIRTNGRYFQALASCTSPILFGEGTILAATSINENAEYNWYDEQGNLVGTGLTCYVMPQQNTTYTLEIIADADGYKAYGTAPVDVIDADLQGLSPNPTTGQVNVSYRMSGRTGNLTLQLISTQGQVVYSQALNGGNGRTSGSVTINTSYLAAGSYTVRLVSNTGKVYSSKILVKQ